LGQTARILLFTARACSDPIQGVRFISINLPFLYYLKKIPLTDSASKKGTPFLDPVYSLNL
jgi:hypothetical protein